MMKQSSRLIAAAVVLGLPASAAMAATGFTASDLNMRTGPSTDYPVVTAIPAGAPVDVLSCSRSWCSVAWLGYQGYSSRSYLDVAGASYAAVPPAMPGPSVVYGEPAYGPAYAYPAPGPRQREALRERREDYRDAMQEQREDYRDAVEDYNDAMEDLRDDAAPGLF
jgi:uncharacterized protein YraI